MHRPVQTAEHPQRRGGEGKDAIDMRQRGIVILRCTARALLQSPGGLRFRTGTQPWLEGLETLQRQPV